MKGHPFDRDGLMKRFGIPALAIRVSVSVSAEELYPGCAGMSTRIAEVMK